MNIFLCLLLTATCALAATLPLQPKKIIPILKQINQLNDDGSYTFGYEGGDGSFRVETKDTTGFIKGRYGYIDLDGKSHVLEYVAGKEAGSSLGFIPSGALVPIPIVRSIPTAEQKALDYQYSSVDEDEDGIPDKAPGQRIVLAPPQPIPVAKLPQFGPQQFFQPAFIRTSPAVIVRQQQQPLRQQQILQDLQFQSVDADQDGIPDGFPIFGGRII